MIHWNRILPAALAFGLTGLVIAGCKKPCDKLADKMKECIPQDKREAPDGGVRKEPAAECKDDLASPDKKDETEELITCAAQKTCADFIKCATEASDKRYRKKVVKELNDISAAKEFTDEISTRLYSCSDDSTMKKHAEVEAACATARPHAFKLLVTKIEGLRDSGKESYMECGRIESIAKSMGGDHPKRAETLCKEAKAARDVSKAREEAKKNVEQKQAKYPWMCDNALAELGKIDSEWSKKQAASLVDVCVVQLGAVIFEATVPKMRYVCDYNASLVYKAVKKHNVTDPKIQDWMKKAAKLCEKG